MESRVGKYYLENENCNVELSSKSTRSGRNASLYREVYGKYGNTDNLPIEDNTNEIDMAKLKELVLSGNEKRENCEVRESLNILEQRKRRIDEQKLYDINKILEKAKYENSKLKETVKPVSKFQRTILSTLESTELSIDEINKAKARYQDTIKTSDKNKLEEPLSRNEDLSMTRELKYKNLDLDVKKQIDDKESDEELSLDLFEDLKPTGNTIVTKPIKEDEEIVVSDIHSGDTRDIDIIKNVDQKQASTNDFFTNSYEFSKKDFARDEDDDFFENSKQGGIFKIILLFLAILMFVGVIVYFVGTYGLGI